MFRWSRPLSGSRSLRCRVVTRKRIEGLLYTALIFLPALGFAGVGVAAQMAAVVTTFVFSPLLLLAIKPRVRCALAEVERRTVSLAASEASPIVEPPTGMTKLIETGVQVSLAHAADRLVWVISAISSRLHGLTHICVLRTRLTTAIATDC